MTFTSRWRVPFACALLLLAAFATPAMAQDFTGGTYILQGGSYTMEVRQEGGNLVVVEPNKTSVYEPQGDGSYHFYNPNTDTVYGLRVIDSRTIEAYKPYVDGNVPSTLVLLSGGGTGDTGGADPADSERYEALAQQYSEMSQTDPDNIQSWTACAAVAMKRSISTVAEADAYAAQMAEMLKMMDAATSPCPEVIAAW